LKARHLRRADRRGFQCGRGDGPGIGRRITRRRARKVPVRRLLRASRGRRPQPGEADRAGPI